jgi:hypothetical protein
MDKVDWAYLEEEYWGESSGGQYFRFEMIDQTSIRYGGCDQIYKNKSAQHFDILCFQHCKKYKLKNLFLNRSIIKQI